MSNYYVKDNFLSESHLRLISDYAFNSSYVFKDHTKEKHPKSVFTDTITEDLFDYQFVRSICYLDMDTKHYVGVPRGELDLIMPYWDQLEFSRLLRCKLNCNPVSNKNYELGWHTDVEAAPEDLWFSAILYLTTCDGCTLLQKGDEIVKVESVANRVLIFPSIWKHTACAPTNIKARFIMNTVFEIDPEKKQTWMS